MPGIAGLVSKRPMEDCRRVVQRMIMALHYDPRFEVGMHASAETGVCVGWTAHPGSFAALQSLRETPGGPRVACAGECFGYDGDDWSDKRSLAALYELYGQHALPRLNGPLSGLIIDDRLGEAVLFNDRCSLERIYIVERNGDVFFASEAKALLRVVPELRALDDAGVAEFLAYGSIGGGRTLFQGLHLLPGGSVWRVRYGEVVDRARYFDPADRPAEEDMQPDVFAEALASTFRRILPRYTHGEPPVGVSVTGGLDTRMIMANLASRPETTCYTYVGLDGETIDASLGRRVAELRGLRHRVLQLGPDFFRDFATYVDRAAFVSDGTATATMAHELYFSELASEIAPVRLTGNYGSEILRSVSTYKPLRLSEALIAGDFQKRIDTLPPPPDGNDCPARQAAFWEVPHHLIGLRALAASVLTLRTPFLDNDLIDLALSASTACFASVKPSLAVIHSGEPRLAALPTDGGVSWPGAGLTYSMRRLYAAIAFKLDYLSTDGQWPTTSMLSQLALAGGTKIGLHQPWRFLFYQKWFRSFLADYTHDIFASDAVRHMPYWRKDGLDAILSHHFRHGQNRTNEINAVLSMAAISQNFANDAQDYQNSQVFPCHLAERVIEPATSRVCK